ncbi:MAG TPA: citrate transporter, partial [Candidatus Eisenbergiella stercorigallinarum]|nr:citrate transporter [Candidatus Eisenbergiella stercorigallinarum]
GTSLGYSFADFITNTGVIAAFSLILVILYFFFCFRRELEKSVAERGEVSYPNPKDAIENRKDFAVSSAIFAAAVVLLVTHAQTGLTVAAIGVFIGAVTLVTAGKDALWLLKKVDYKTLLFFIGLFVVVGGLEQTGILELIAAFIAQVSGDNAMIMVAIVLWISAVASAFVDNIPFAATMIPVIQSLSAAQGVDLSVLAWSLSMGTDIGGSATPIGASANVVGISVAAKEGHVIGWGKYCRYAAPATVLVVLFSMIAIYVRYF